LPSTAWTIADVIALASAGRDHRPIDSGPDRPRPLLAGHRGHEVRPHQLAVVRDGRSDERHLERRDERLGLA
jgi:hypothetical protein